MIVQVKSSMILDQSPDQKAQELRWNQLPGGVSLLEANCPAKCL